MSTEEKNMPNPPIPYILKCATITLKFGSKQGRFIAKIPNFGGGKEDYTYIFHRLYKIYVLDNKDKDEDESNGKQQYDNVSLAS